MLINTSSPQYQRWMQKANAMSQDDPNRFRILMNLTNDKFAGDVMRKRISNLGMVIKQQQRERTHTLARRKQSTDLAYRDRETSDALKTLKEARFMGYASMIPAGLSGVSKYRQGMEEANLIRQQTTRMDEADLLRRKIYGGS